jgi:hypothetical protein
MCVLIISLSFYSRPMETQSGREVLGGSSPAGSRLFPLPESYGLEI